MISNQPDPARTSYVPALRLSAVGGATVTGTLFVSSSRVNVRLSDGIGGQPAGGVTAVRMEAAPRARFVTATVKCRASCDPPSIGQSNSSGAMATSSSRVTKMGRRTSPIAWSR